MACDHSWQPIFRPGNSEDYFRDNRPMDFAAGAVGFNSVNAWWLSELSRLIYRRDASEGIDRPDRRSRNDFLTRVGLVESRFFNAATVQTALVETVEDGDNAYAVLVLRGTSGPVSSWMTNLNMIPCPWPAGAGSTVGSGTASLKSGMPSPPPLACLQRPLFFTGHSLGGALATLAASLRRPRAVYTFGAPRIGDPAFARSLKGIPVFNVVNPRDIVTELPPSGPWSRFTHAGTIVNNSEKAKVHRRIGQAPAFLAGHAPLNYTAQLPVAFDN